MPFRWQGPPPMMGGEGELTQLKIYHYRKEEQQNQEVGIKKQLQQDVSTLEKAVFPSFFLPVY